MGRFDELRGTYEALITSQLSPDDEASVHEIISMLAARVKQLGVKVLNASLSSKPADEAEAVPAAEPATEEQKAGTPSNAESSKDNAAADTHEIPAAGEEATGEAQEAGGPSAVDTPALGLEINNNNDDSALQISALEFEGAADDDLEMMSTDAALLAPGGKESVPPGQGEASPHIRTSRRSS